MRASSGLVSSGPFVLDAVSRELRRGDASVRLQDQPCRILRLLLARPGVVVTREELRRELWPDGTFVDYEHSLNAAIRRLRAAIGDVAREGRWLETLPGRGYRWRGEAGVRGGRLAVLPFTSRPGGDGFAEGLADELIAQIGEAGGGDVQVIARMSAAACAGAGQRASEVGRVLGADYLLEGSLRRHGELLRVAVWLVEAREEVQAWRGLYSRRISDPVAAQIELASAIAMAVAGKLLGRNTGATPLTPGVVRQGVPAAGGGSRP